MKDGILTLTKGAEQPEVQAILEIAEDLVSKNKVLQIDLLYKIAKRKLKYTNQTVHSAIEVMIKNKIFVEGSKLLKKDVLFNKYRKKIYEIIRIYPGLHFSLIQRKVSEELRGKKMSAGHFIWHLEVLLKFELIKRLQVKNYTLFIPVEMEDEFGIFFFLLRDRINKKIVEYLIKEEPFPQAELARKLLESKGSVHYHLKSLVEHSILRAEKNEQTGYKEVWLNQEKKELIVSITRDLNNI